MSSRKILNYYNEKFKKTGGKLTGALKAEVDNLPPRTRKKVLELARKHVVLSHKGEGLTDTEKAFRTGYNREKLIRDVAKRQTKNQERKQKVSFEKELDRKAIKISGALGRLVARSKKRRELEEMKKPENTFESTATGTLLPGAKEAWGYAKAGAKNDWKKIKKDAEEGMPEFKKALRSKIKKAKRWVASKLSEDRLKEAHSKSDLGYKHEVHKSMSRIYRMAGQPKKAKQHEKAADAAARLKASLIVKGGENTKELRESHTKDQLYTLTGRYMAKFAKSKRKDELKRPYEGESSKTKHYRTARRAADKLLDRLNASKKFSTAAIAEAKKNCLKEDDRLDEKHTKFQALQAASYHGTRAKKTRSDAEATQKQIIQTVGHNRRARLTKAKEKFERRAGQHERAKNIAKRLSGDLSPLWQKIHDLQEKAPPGAKAERMVKHIKAGYAKDGELTKKEKAIAYATAWKAHNRGSV